jgi:hypothetical protein
MERYDTLPALTIAKILCGRSFGPKAEAPRSEITML